MNLGALVPGVLLGLIGLVIIGGVLWLVLKNVFFADLGGSRQKRNLKRSLALLHDAQALADKQQYAQCFPLIKSAFVLEYTQNSEKIVDAVLEHNLAALGLILKLSEKYPVPLSNLPVLEELFQIRAAISKAYIDANLTVSKLGKKKAEGDQSKPPPAWAVTEFSKKIKELKDKLAVNKKSLELEIGKLFQKIGRGSEVHEVTYH